MLLIALYAVVCSCMPLHEVVCSCMQLYAQHSLFHICMNSSSSYNFDDTRFHIDQVPRYSIKYSYDLFTHQKQ